MKRMLARSTTMSAPLLVALLAGDVSAQIVDLEFPGGSVGQFVDLIRRTARDVNIVVTPEARLVPAPPVELRQVEVGAALELIEGPYELGDGRLVELLLSSIQWDEGAPVFKVSLRTRRAGAPAGLRSHAWSLVSLLDADTQPEHVLTAIEAALELYGDRHTPPQLRFHRETGLLLVRAGGEQIDTIETLLEAYEPPRSGALDALREEKDEAHARIGTLEDDLAVATHERMMAERELVAARMRVELLSQQLDAAEQERMKMRAEIGALTVERDIIANRLQMRIEALERQLAERGDADGR